MTLMTLMILNKKNPESTIVAEFEPGYRSSAQYQSETGLIANLRRQIEILRID